MDRSKLKVKFDIAYFVDTEKIAFTNAPNVSLIFVGNLIFSKWPNTHRSILPYVLVPTFFYFELC